MAESDTPQADADTGTNGRPVAAVQPSVVVKKYANRRLYNTETSSYITLENLAEMIRAGRDFVVYDAKSSEDITRGVLTQIIVEEESKGTSMLPTNFLRQLIGFYGDSLQGVLPRYLEQAMSSFARQQQQMRTVVQQTFGSFLPVGVEELGRHNMAVFERAMSMFTPFHRGGENAAAKPAQDVQAQDMQAREHPAHEAAGPHSDHAELDHLRQEVESLKRQLAAARAEAVIPAPVFSPAEEEHAASATAAPNVMADPPPAPSSTLAAAMQSSRKMRVARTKA